MTYIIGVKCDICGTVSTSPYEGQEHTIPEAWGSFTVHYPVSGPSHQQRHMCPVCAQAMYEGRTPVQEYLVDKFSADKIASVQDLRPYDGRDL